MVLPAQIKDTLLVRIAAAVSPAPSAFPTRIHAAPCIPNGICDSKQKVSKHQGIFYIYMHDLPLYHSAQKETLFMV